MAASGHSPADRVPPHNLEAEQSLLGSMFLSSEAVEVGLDVVSPEDFYRTAHGKIYTAIRDLYTRGEPVDQITVADRLESVGHLDQAGGKPYLLDITGMVPTAANAAYYAEIVKRTSVLRQLITAGTDIVTLGYDSVEDLDAAIEQAEKRVFDVTNKRVSSNFRTLNELMTVGFEQIEQLYDRKEHITGVPTGFPDLDSILAGLHAGDLIILAARPSVGKTAFALNIAVEAAKKQFPVAVFSLEMSSEQLVQRILCAEARIDSQRLRTGYLNENDWPQIMQAMGRMNDAPLWVDDTPSISIIEVRAKARRLFRDKKQGLIIIDYLQLMQPQNRRSENRQVEIADISRGLKILAKELQVPIVALSQLSRAVEQRTSKRPMLSDLRECVTGETLVTLADGRRVPIKSLVGTTPEVLAVDDRGKIVSAFSDAVWPVGERPVFRVTLASGRVVRATEKHRFLTGRGWVRLAELSLADRIAIAENAASSDLFWDAIRTIEPDGVEEVYDLTVPGPASWLADGIVSHNSGAIEQDADVVMFIHRDTIGAGGGGSSEGYGDEKPSGMPAKGEAEIIVAKHRNGPVDSCFVAYLDRYTKFVPLAKNVP
ncbi:MAG: replicative DNA helicase [Coriobacteriia bacterium]